MVRGPQADQCDGDPLNAEGCGARTASI